MLIKLKNRALERILNFLKLENKNNFLRLGVRKSGCLGMSYFLKFTSHINENDLVFFLRKIKFVTNKEHISFLDGLEIDFLEKENFSSCFKFKNLNIKRRCGCGNSFSI